MRRVDVPRLLQGGGAAYTQMPLPVRQSLELYDVPGRGVCVYMYLTPSILSLTPKLQWQSRGKFASQGIVDLTMHVSRPERLGFYPGLSY